MVDTARDITHITGTLFADNAAGDITPQDMRDFAVSVMGEYGALYVSAPVTSISGGATEDIDDYTHALSNGTITTSLGDGKITVGNAGVYLVLLCWTVKATDGTMDKDLTFKAVHYDGSGTDTNCRATQTITTVGEYATMVGMDIWTMAANTWAITESDFGASTNNMVLTAIPTTMMALVRLK